MEAVAKLNNCPTSPRKIRLVVDLIRNKEVEAALDILKYNPKEASRNIEKLLLSAMANWQAKNEGKRLEDSQLYVKKAYVDRAGMLKRWRPAPMGRATRIRKRSNHVCIVVDSKLDMGNNQIEETVTDDEKKIENAAKPKQPETVKKETNTGVTKKDTTPKKETKVEGTKKATKEQKTTVTKKSETKKTENKIKSDGAKGKSDK